MHDAIREASRARFRAMFGSEGGERTLFAPGRVNLIGEHTDYNGGYVLPMTLDKGVWAVFRPRRDRQILLAAEAFNDLGVQVFDLDASGTALPQNWTAYPLGMLEVVRRKGYALSHGWEMLVGGDLPIGGGLSSSHALMVLSGLVMAELFGLAFRDEAGRRELALLTKQCENEQLGVQSGIMDGFVIALGKPNEALLLRCSTLEYRHIPVRLPGAELWIIDSMVARTLSGSAYNQRFAECQEALRLFRAGGVELEGLADLDAMAWQRHEHLLADPLLHRRARHVISENLRTLKAADRLREGDMTELGRLLNESHVSLRDDYQVTGEALDTLAELCWQQPACLGARMTGAGFGGCFIVLLEQDGAEAALQAVERGYAERMGLMLMRFPTAS